jgi:xylulokinase
MMARLTGSLAFERFTGPQIRRFYKKEEKKYKETASIGLVSSFMVSLLLGDIAPIDYGDGSGMNLMDISKKRWHRDILKVTAPDLASKLPPLVHPITAIGRIHEYFVKRYGFKTGTILNAWSGDNPNSLIGLGGVESGEAVISLGTSDTFFAITKKMKADPNGEGHVFVAPTGDYMSLICFKNGSLARERIKKMFNLNWNDFSAYLRRTKPGNRGKILLPWFEPEIVPRVFGPGLRRFLLEKDDIPGHVRGVVEAQAMSMKIHSAWMKVRPSRIFVTGGASENREILKIIADVFETPVYFLKVSKSAVLGAALRAAYCYFRKTGRKISWPDVIRGFISYDRNKCLTPDRESSCIYQRLTKFYRLCEEHAVSIE